MIKICGMATFPCTVKSFMLNNLKYVSDRGFECYCIANPDEDNDLDKEILEKVQYIPNPIKWGFMTPVDLIKTVYRMYKIFRKHRFDIIQYATMNTALCASIAGWLARVPIRVNLLWGIDFVQFKGWRRWLYYYSTLLICKLSTHVQPDSKGNLDYCRSLKMFNESNSEVLYNGSACGVDLKKYDFSQRENWRKEIHKELHLEHYKRVYGFVGIVYLDKGINELFEAFFKINDPDSCLVLVGSLERVATLDQELYGRARNTKNIIFTGPVPNAAKFYAAFDYLLLPSYAEGFGMVVLEAAAVGTPTIVSNIKGPTDFVKDNVNGLICEPRSAESLEEVLRKSCEMTDEEYQKLASNAYTIVKRDFDSEVFKEKFYENRLKLYNELSLNN